MTGSFRSTVLLLLAFLSFMSPIAQADTDPSLDDPYRYLEDVDGQGSMDWVHARNAITTQELEGDAGYRPTYDRLLAIYDSSERIPGITKIGAWYYNFWRDAVHVRGIMRRTTLDEYRKAEPTWETVIDVDALAAADAENWVWNLPLSRPAPLHRVAVARRRRRYRLPRIRSGSAALRAARRRRLLPA